MSQKCTNCNITAIDDQSTNCKYCGHPYLSKAKQIKDENAVNFTFAEPPTSEPIQQSQAMENSNNQNHTQQVITPKPSGSWKVMSLTILTGLLLALGVIGFQSFQIQASSNKIKTLEDKSVANQKNFAEIETLSSQNSQLTADLNQTKSELEAKSKLLQEVQEKATKLAEETKANDDKFAKLEAENKALATKNATLTTQNASTSKELDSIKNTPLGKLITVK
jgi:hypothetical protein